MADSKETEETESEETRRGLSPHVIRIAHLRTTYDVTPDGQRFVMIQSPEGTQEPLQMVYIPNWFEELELLVPNN